MKTIPSTKTAARAVCQGIPNPRTTVNAKKAFSPNPGASPNGRLAYTAITSIAVTEARIVVIAIIWNTSGSLYPSMLIAFDNTVGLTTMM